MKETYQTGLDGENRAAEWLQKHRSMILLEKRYRNKAGEIDLIMLDGKTIVFVEVKTRLHAGPGNGLMAVDRRKQQKLLRCAQLYLKLRPGYAQRFSPRMDIMEVLYTEEGTYARHTPNAFSLT